ncbi:MFS transporter [Rhizobium sp. Root708]|uniref:MFS transporter n=1 Tax=Rhizobium sp. Root708 TaxID=1736592 RepID=UPI0006F7F423|nr:MFS transporter [Rhizobium sp. Root708]KRB49112.1 MFS transporter [Rhizobium sp. Root708]
MNTITPKQRLRGAAVGAFVEWYDFHIYALTAPTIASHFFPKTEPVTALISTFAIYGIAFLARPLGGTFFGYFGDKFGRMRILSLTVLLMGTVTFATGLLPTHDQIGIWAPVLLVTCRLAQSCFAAGETSGALSYVVETAPVRKRGAWAALIGGWGFLPVAFAAAIIYLLRLVIGDDAYGDWGWRLPFLIGGALGVIGLWLRKNLDDPEESNLARAEARDVNPVKAASFRSSRATLNAIFLVSLHAVTAFTLLGYMYTFLLQTAKVSTATALLSNAAANVLIFVLLPVGGSLADRFGRRPMLLIGASWLFLAAYPAFALASNGTVMGAVAGQLALVIGFCIYAGSSFVTTLELFPTAIRQSGHALAYNLSFAVFGGFTPLLATYMVSSTGSPLSPAILLMIAAIVGAVTVTVTPETKGIDLRSAAVS